MRAAIGQPPSLDNARRQYVELFGSALVMNTYLKIALLAVSLVACGLIALNLQTARRFTELKPLVIRTDDVGRAQAVATVYKAITDANPSPTLVSILQLDTLSKFATSENAKLVVPVETAGLLGAAQTLRGVLDGVPSGSKS